MKLILGDCLEVMKTFPSESVDAVITDPPYNYGKKYGKHDDNMPWSEYCDWLTIRFMETARVLKDGGVIYFTLSTQMMRLCEDWPFFCFRQWLIWHRPNIINVHVHADWKQDYEMIYYGGKGKFKTIKGTFPDTAVIKVAAPQSNFKEKRQHVCQRPIRLLTMILNRIDAKIILDPFMGSGTTGVACIQAGRDFIGIEIDPDYFAIAEGRIKDAQAQGKLWSGDIS